MAAHNFLRGATVCLLLAFTCGAGFAASGDRLPGEMQAPPAKPVEVDRNSIECPDGQAPSSAVAGLPCGPDTAQTDPARDGTGNTDMPSNAVFLPDLLIDLFPLPTADLPGAASRGAGAADGSTAREPVRPGVNDGLVSDTDPTGPVDADAPFDSRTPGADVDGAKTTTPTVDSGDDKLGAGASRAGLSSPAEVAPSDGSGSAAPAGAAPPAVTSARPLSVSPVAISGEFVPDEVLVTVDGNAAVVAALAADFGLEVRSQRLSVLLGMTVARLGIPDGRQVATVLAELAGDPRAIDRVPNHVYTLQQAATIVNYAFQRIALDADGASGADVSIAVIDTAVDAGHEALAGVIAGSYDAMPDTPVVDRNHGTSVTGLIAGVGVLRGMAPGSKVFHARAFESGRSTMGVILDALDWAAGQDARIVNMSFVGPKNELLRTACASARSRGLILVAAAGNNGPKAPWGYPAAYDGVIAVTATDAADALMPQANRGPYVFVSAPGVDMVAPAAGGSDIVTGTSFAAAIVSGAIANLLHEDPGRSAGWVEKALSETAGDLGPAGRDPDFGFGLINAKAAAGLK